MLDSSLNESPLPSPTNTPPPQNPNHKRAPIKRIAGLTLVTLGIALGIILVLHFSTGKQTLDANLSARLKPQTTSLTTLNHELSHTSQATSTLTINGNLAVSNSIELQPTSKPTDPSAGQLYYDQTANQLGYYNGTGFVYLQGSGSVTNNNTTNVFGGGSTGGGGISGSGQPGQLAVFGSASSLSGSLLSETGTTVTAAAALHLQASANSASALQVQNTAGQNVFAVNTTNNQVVLGNDSAAPTATTIRGGAGVGNNITGTNFTIQGSNGTGGANGGDIILETGQSAQGGIQLDNAGSTVSSGGTLSMSFTVGAKQSRVLLVMTNYTATGLTYDGRPLTLLASITSGQRWASGVQTNLWYLLNPPSGTFTLATTNGGAGTTMGAASYYNVSQTTPFGTPLTTNGEDADAQTSLSVPTTSTSQVVIDAMSMDRDSSLDSCATLTPGEAVRWSVHQLFFTTECGADVVGNGGNVNLSWHVIQTDWTEAAVVLNPSVPGSTPLQVISGSNPNTMFDRLHITSTGNVGINNSNPQYALDVNGAISSNMAVYSSILDTVNSSTLNIGNLNASGIQIGNSNSNVPTSIIGTLLVKPTPGNNSATSFQIQDASTTPLFTADTSTMRINITGTASSFATLSLNDTHLAAVQTTAPTVAAPTNCGTGATAAITAGSTDVVGSFTLVTGSGSPTTCDTTVTFNMSYGAPPKSIIVMPTLAIGGATDSLAARISAASATSFTIQLSPTNAAASTTYSFYYITAG